MTACICHVKVCVVFTTPLHDLTIEQLTVFLTGHYSRGTGHRIKREGKGGREGVREEEMSWGVFFFAGMDLV